MDQKNRGNNIFNAVEGFRRKGMGGGLGGLYIFNREGVKGSGRVRGFKSNSTK